MTPKEERDEIYDQYCRPCMFWNEDFRPPVHCKSDCEILKKLEDITTRAVEKSAEEGEWGALN